MRKWPGRTAQGAPRPMIESYIFRLPVVLILCFTWGLTVPTSQHRCEAWLRQRVEDSEHTAGRMLVAAVMPDGILEF